MEHILSSLYISFSPSLYCAILPLLTGVEVEAQKTSVFIQGVRLISAGVRIHIQDCLTRKLYTPAEHNATG